MITICYITCRKNNPFNWFWDGLRKQKENFPDIAMQLIVVDYWADERSIDLTNDLGIETLHITPLPSVWQGKYQLTKQPHYAVANARNTGFIYAIHGHIAFCDDLTVLGSRWLETVVETSKHNYVTLGAYKKLHDMEVSNGRLLNYRQEPNGTDSRWNSCPDDGKIQVDGSYLYGCSFVMPLEAALKINGFDCLTDGIGYEDQSFGMRLVKAGYKLFYDKRLFTAESEDHIQNDITMIRSDELLSKERYFEVLKNFGLHRSIYSANDRKDTSHIMIEVATQKDFNPVWNFFNLRGLRSKRENGGVISIDDMGYPEKWWVNDNLISEM